MRILIADDDPISTRILTTSLAKWGYEVVATRNGLEAWQAMQAENAPQLAILDWMMPGMDGSELCRRVRRDVKTSSTYLIMLTALSRKEDLVAGLEAGADDYLSKPFDRHELRVRVQAGARIVELQRSLAQRVNQLEVAIIEREHAEDALRNLSLTDDLTLLYNRRGFFTLAEHQFKTCRRAGQNLLVIYADMDGLKQINDTFGHSEGSLAIAKTADILRQSFRESDIVARLGGDEFAIVAPTVAHGAVENVTRRLHENLRLYNLEANHSYQLSLSIGVVSSEQSSALGIEELVAQADRAMYEEKRKKKAASEPSVVGFEPAVIG